MDRESDSDQKHQKERTIKKRSPTLEAIKAAWLWKTQTTSTRSSAKPKRTQASLEFIRKTGCLLEIRGGKEAQSKGERTNCKITLYQNGFQVDDGPFRDYNEPESKKFMAELNKG